MNTVTIQCPTCGRPFVATADDIRTANDGSFRLRCKDCRRPRYRVTAFPGSAAGIILAAAADLPEPFGLPALVMAAWRARPDRFGLDGYDHPDSNRVNSEVVKMSGPGGTLERVGVRTYRVTPFGRLKLESYTAVA